MDDNPNIYAYKRIGVDEELIVYCNFTSQTCKYDASYLHNNAKILMSNYDSHEIGQVRAYEAIVFNNKKL